MSIEKLANFKLTIHPKYLAHCKVCREPMYCLYEQSLRYNCYSCAKDMEMTSATSS